MTEGCDPAEVALWVRYRAASDESARDSLFLHHLPWANSIARGVHYRLRTYRLDREDFVQNATIGLLEAMSRFDPARGVAFRSYALPRIRGAVFNGLRVMIGQKSQGPDFASYDARLMSLRDGSEGDAFSVITDTIVGLGIGFLLDSAARSDDGDSQDPAAYTQHSQSQAHIKLALERLPARQKMIVESHYYHFIPFQDIAASIGVTKGRVSQLHHAALTALREELRNIV